MKSVLVTGATGFIGRHTLQPLLDRNFVVHAVHSGRLPILAHPNLHWHAIDLHHTQAIQHLFKSLEVTHLLHLAWYVKPTEYRTSIHNLTWLTSSIDLLKAFIQFNGKRAVFTGSSAEYDWKYGHCKEFLTPLHPQTLYGTVKHALHLLSDSLANSNKVSFAWARLFFLFGEHEYAERLVSSMICHLLQNKPFHLQNGYQIRDFMYVKDVADAMVALLDSNVKGPVNIASGHPISLKDLLVMISNKLGRHHLINLTSAYGANEKDKLLLADTTRLQSEVDWHPSYTLDAALNETISWWKEKI